jgi:hypothetical protein
VCLCFVNLVAFEGASEVVRLCFCESWSFCGSGRVCVRWWLRRILIGVWCGKRLGGAGASCLLTGILSFAAGVVASKLTQACGNWHLHWFVRRRRESFWQ